MQVQLSEDHLAQDQPLQDHLVDLRLVDPLVRQALEVLVLSDPLAMGQQYFPLVDLEETLDLHHPAPAPVGELEASVPTQLAYLQASTSALEVQADFPLSARDIDHQAVFLGPILDSEAQTLAWEADLELPPLGLEQVPEATTLPQ